MQKNGMVTKLSDKWISAGGVVIKYIDGMPNVYVRLPSGDGSWGSWSLPKGRQDDGESLMNAAIREVGEELGVRAKIVNGGYIGMYIGQYSTNHFFLMDALSEPGEHDFETAEVKLLPFDEAIELFMSVGNVRDVNVLNDAKELLKGMKQKVSKKIDDNTEPVLMNEWKVNLLGKLLFGSIALWMAGKTLNLKIKGTPQEVNAVMNAMMSSKRFQDELNNPGATVHGVMQKLNLKNADARDFERILGVKWPL